MLSVKQKEQLGGELSNIAVIIDECHELFNPRLCDQDKMWGNGENTGVESQGIMQSLARGEGCKVFLLSGTPWRDKHEMKEQLQLVSGGRRPAQGLNPSNLQSETIARSLSVESELASLKERFGKS
eukprot:3629558-Rhodomonas_salina.1